MSDNTAIEWTDTTWNPVVGCAKVSPGCKHCYAETMAARHVLMSQALGWTSPYLPVVDIIERRNDEGKLEGYTRRWNGRAVTLPERLAEPLSWRKPRRVFVNSMSDLFHEDVPFEFVAAVFGVMAYCRQHTFQVLTKRPGRMLEFFGWLRHHGGEQRSAPFAKFRPFEDGQAMQHLALDLGDFGTPKCRGAWTACAWPLPNVWLGVSAENQATADERIPLLLQAPAAVRFVSAEPLLGPIKLHRGHASCPEHDIPGGRCMGYCLSQTRPDWFIIGGESGPGARDCSVDWLRALAGDCRRAGIPYFVKQLGARPTYASTADQFKTVSMHLRDRKGGDMAEWPEDLRVRQFPEVTRAG